MFSLAARIIFALSFVKLWSCENESLLFLPRFWTNTGFCPIGHNHSAALLSKEVKMNLQLIGALPNGALNHVRIHWLLDLVDLVGFERNNIPKYDFSNLDKFVWRMDRRDLSLGFEFMGNPSKVFTTNHSLAAFLWEDLSFQIARRYLDRLGPAKILKWRFESWNEPDLESFNTLQFDIEKFQEYILAIRRGLNAAGRRYQPNLYFKLHGPAGLFKNADKHKLCWHALEMCNANINKCPVDVLTYHRKGNGTSSVVAPQGKLLLKEIFDKYPKLKWLPVSNNEADPIAGWSTPRAFQADVRYAVMTISMIFDHWTSRINVQTFKNLLYISHDNAFISYHPHEFDQRTLFAYFRMNNTEPEPYYQIIQKPVYIALGMMGNLAPYATDVEQVSNTIQILKTYEKHGEFLCFVVLSTAPAGMNDDYDAEIHFPENMHFSYVIEYLEYQNTDPVVIWKFYHSPPYPNSAIRLAMRQNQGPRIFKWETLESPHLAINLSLRAPWLIQIRLCASSIPPPPRPYSLRISTITTAEVLLTWKEKPMVSRCVVQYQVWYLSSNQEKWQQINLGWHTPFLSFHFAPKDGQTKGSYMVRSVDTFGRFSKFSRTKVRV